MRMSLSEIRGHYSSSKKQEDGGTIGARIIMRPTSFYLTWLALRMNLTANSVTAISAVVGTIGLGLFVSGTPSLFVVGAITLTLRNLLDYVDGNIARATNTISQRGLFFDRLVDNVMDVATPVALGIGLDRYGLAATFLTSIDASLGGHLFVLAGLVLSICVCAAALVSDEVEIVYGRQSWKVYSSGGGSGWSTIYRVGVNIQTLSPEVRMVCALFGPVALGIYSLLYVTIMGAGISAMIWRWATGKLDRKETD